MSSPEKPGRLSPLSPADAELDRLFSLGVQDLVGAAEPPRSVWPRIARQLRAGPSPLRSRSRQGSWRTASLAQAVALTSLLLAVGLSLGPRMQRPWSMGEGASRVQTPTRSPDTDSGLNASPKASPILADEGMLSVRETLLWRKEQARQLQVMARDTAPTVDPVLKYRRQWDAVD